MKGLRSLRLSLRTLFAHKLRSTLAATGIAIGIAAVFVTTALGQAAEAELMKNFGAMGTRELVVRPAQLKKTPARRQVQGFASSLKLDDWAAVVDLPGLAGVAPLVEGAVKIETERGLVATQMLGTTSAYFRVKHFRVAQGAPFNDEDTVAAPRIAVLGGRIAHTLFPSGDAVGQDVRIAGAAFEVVCRLEPKGMTADGSDVDNQVFIPVQTAMRRIFDSRSLSAIFVGVRRSEDLSAAENQIRNVLRERHQLDRRKRPDDFTIQNQFRFIKAQRQITRPLTFFTTGLAGLSLFVGGAGILALMLLSVQERRPEIGLRVAVGARARDILWQFLAEALVLALGGGALGVTLGAVVTWGIALVTHWVLRVSLQAVLFSLGTAASIGLAFGALPARKAARIAPARALTLE